MDSLPDAVEVHRVSPYLPPRHIGRVLVAGPPLGLNGLYYDPSHVGFTVILAFLLFIRSWVLASFASHSVFFALKTT